MPFSFDATDAMFQEGGAMYERGQIIGSVKTTRVVAVAGSIGDWAAYATTENWDDESVAQHGDKISEEEARRLFPQFNEMAYRR